MTLDSVTTPPTSFEELIALPEDFKIAIQDPRSATPGLGNWCCGSAPPMATARPRSGPGLKPHILTVTREWSESYNLFLEGEADMALSYTTSPAYHIIAEGDDTIHAALFSEGHLAQTEVAGILKSSDNVDLARQFLAYLTSVQGSRSFPRPTGCSRSPISAAASIRPSPPCRNPAPR